MLNHHKQLIKPSYLELNPYIPGKNSEVLKQELKLDRVIKLASNENPFGPSPKAIQAASETLKHSHRYPDSDITFLRRKLSEKFSMPIENIIVGSGSDCLFHTIAQAFLNFGDEVILSEFAFAVFEIATLVNQGRPIIVKATHYQHDLSKMAKEINAKTKLIFLANPNNPTGTWFTHAEFETFLQKVPKHILVIYDEAYFEYMEGYRDYPDALSLQKSFSNLIITRTFSKAYGLAGFRVGYAFADRTIVELLNRIRPPFTVTVPAQAAATAALDDESFLQKTISHNRTARHLMEDALKKLSLQNIAIAGNFVTVNFGPKVLDIFNTLLTQGIILRPLVNYKMDNFLRISLGSETELNLAMERIGLIA